MKAGIARIVGETHRAWSDMAPGVAVPSRPARVAPLFSAIPARKRRHAMSALRDQPSLARIFRVYLR